MGLKDDSRLRDAYLALTAMWKFADEFAAESCWAKQIVNGAYVSMCAPESKCLPCSARDALAQHAAVFKAARKVRPPSPTEAEK